MTNINWANIAFGIAYAIGSFMFLKLGVQAPSVVHEWHQFKGQWVVKGGLFIVWISMFILAAMSAWLSYLFFSQHGFVAK